MEFTTLQAKTQLSKLLAMAKAGEEVIITSGRDKQPVAQLLPVQRKGGIKFGLLKDIMPPITSDLFEPLPEEELRAWEESELWPTS